MKYKRKIITIIIFTILVLLPLQTAAKECNTSAEKYGLYIEKGNKNNEYIIIKDNSLACDKNTKNKKLKIESINNIVDTSNKVIKKGNETVKIKANLQVDGTKNYITVTLKDLETEELVTIEYSFIKEISDIRYVPTEINTNYYGLCNSLRENVAYLGIDAYNYFSTSLGYCWQENVIKGTNYKEQDLQQKIDEITNKWQNYQNNKININQDFINNFNYIKEKALLAKNNIANNKVSSKKQTLKCNYKYINTTDPNITYVNELYDEVISSTDLYPNKDYYYTTKKDEKEKITYTYNYAVGNTKTETHDSCQKTCEEVVKVEYSAPIATKAGNCIDYKVKVTSYVRCESSFTAPQPKVSNTYCSPAPTCTNISSVQSKKPQAGPTEDFDNCIKSCDGGKYSEKCSLKCYKEIYNKDIQIENTTEPLSTKNEYTLKECLKDNKDYYGCYGYNSSQINWYSNLNYDENGNKLTTNWNNKYTLGRWYLDKVFTNTPDPNYNYNSGGYDITGIEEKCTGTYCGTHVADNNGFYRENNNGNLCSDSCEWNKTSCASDQYLNPGTIVSDAKNNQALYEKAKNQCLEETTFKENTKEYVISIKYDTHESNGRITVEEISFPNTENSSEKQSSTRNILENDNVFNNGNEKIYTEEIKFPGTYINNKTGEITYQKPTNKDDWYFDKNKVCLPLNIKTTNAKWLDWKTKKENSKYTEEQVKKELKGKKNTSNGYNIKADIKNFGYFDWNFNINCFYAVKNDNANEKNSTKLNNYTIKTIDRTDLFKDTINFNWTNKATITSLKNPKYLVYPERVITEIEKNAAGMYNSDEYLDYKFYLTSEKLKEIKEYNKKNGYGIWNGTVKEVNGINAYSSNLFRGKDAILTEKNGSVLKKGTEGVNNENFIYE